jgi:hypothetical protein
MGNGLKETRTEAEDPQNSDGLWTAANNFILLQKHCTIIQLRARGKMQSFPEVLKFAQETLEIRMAGLNRVSVIFYMRLEG